MAIDTRSSQVFQDDMRGELLPWMLFPVGLAGLGLALGDRDPAPPPSLGALGILILAFAALVWVTRKHNIIAAWLLALGSLAMILLARHWFPDSEAYQAMIYPVVVSCIILRPRAAIAVAAAATVALQGDVSSLAPLRVALTFPQVGTITLWGVLFLVIMAQRPQKIAVAWALQAYGQAREGLEMARDRQLELKQALADLDLANREVVRLNDLLLAAREAVEEARRVKEEFVANVSHELRTPLNMIIGFSDEILERPEIYSHRLPDDLLDDVATIKRNSEHLARLVDDVLDLVEADVGFTRLAKEWTSLKKIAEEASESMSGFFAKKKLQLTIHVPDDLPAVCCDHMRIRQVLLNLLSNAARFTQQGGARLEASAQDGVATVRVADTGPGIAPAVCNQLFEPFQQADPSIRRRYGGTGLGLAISKRFVEMHGGKIWIESSLGVGTTVSLTLPLNAEEPRLAARRWFSPYQEYEPRTRPSLAPSADPKPRAIVIERGKALSNLLYHYVDGLEVTTLSRTEQVGVAIQKEPSRALLINRMPTANLSDSLNHLPPLAFDIPIITCWVPEREAAFSQGIQDYLIKPIRRPDLLASISRIAPEAQRILLVEDDEEASQLFTRMLSAAESGYTIAHANDGENALALMRTWHPDLVLLDLIMPGLNGFEVLAIKAGDEALRNIPVIVISAKDPNREPIMSNALILTRQSGLSARDLVLTIEAIMAVLPPRFGDPVLHGTPVPSPASG